jgi:cytochrome bd-type quinol oxidase subunit 2
MSHRAAAWLAWFLWAICVALVALAVVLVLNTPPVPARDGPNFAVLAAVPFLTYATVGAFVAARRPKNAVGWVLCGMGFVFACPRLRGGVRRLRGAKR